MASRLIKASYGRNTKVSRAWPSWRPHEPSQPAQVQRERHFPRLAEKLDGRRQPSRQGDDREDEQRSDGAQFGEQQPVAQQQQQQGGGNQAAPEIVEDLPLRQAGKRIGDAPGIRSRDAGQEPLGDLPVAANPTVAPIDVGVVTGRIFFVQLDVADQRRAGMAGFDQIVAEDRVFRKAAGDGLLKGIHIIDPFANKRPLLEHILIDVRNRARVGVNPDVAGKQFDKPGTGCAWQAHAHARLQDAVAFGHHALDRIELRPVQRMSHRSHELAGGIARKLGVGIEGDDKFDGRQNRSVADDLGKAFRWTRRGAGH